MIDLRFVDRLNEYLPLTFSQQWDQTINGRSNQIFLRNKKVKILDSKCRKTCAKELGLRVILLPFDAIGRTIYNGTYTLVKVLEWNKVRLLVLKDPNKNNKKKWSRAKWAILDGLLATCLSPFQGSAKALRLFLAIFKPSTLYKHPLLQNIRHRQAYEIKELTLEFRKAIKKVALNPVQLRDEYPFTMAHAMIMKGCFDYAIRWNLFNSKNNNYLERIGSQTIYKEMPFNSIKEQHTLKIAFKKALQNGFTQNSLDTLLKEFKTKKQKIVLNQFANKKFTTFWNKSHWRQIKFHINHYNDKQNELNKKIPSIEPTYVEIICLKYFENLRKEITELKEISS